MESYKKTKETHCHINTKISYIILTFLMCNRGKRYTSKQLWDYIMEHQLVPSTRGMPQHTYLKRMVQTDKWRSKGVLSRVEMEGENPILFYIP